MNKLLDRITRPVPFFVVSLLCIAEVLIDPARRVLFGAFIFIWYSVQAVCYLIDLFRAPDEVKDNLIQVYVNDATFDRVEQFAEMVGLSVPVFCSLVLQDLKLGDFADFKPDEEDDHGQ